MPFPSRASAAVLALTAATATVGQAQDCPGLPAIDPPKLERCNGFLAAVAGVVGIGCKGRNDRLQFAYERQTRGFATGLDYNSDGLFLTSLDDSARIATTDDLRGCRGETVNLEFTPGNVQYFEYQLVSPGGVVVSQSNYTTWTGDRILGPALTLPETGTYKLITRTVAPGVVKTYQDKKHGTQYVTKYPRHFHVGFRSDAKVAALGVGDKIDMTATNTQPFIRRVFVKGGTKARFRLASQGTGDFSYVVLRESGEEVARGARTAFADVPAVSPTTDETFRVEARPFLPNASVGIQLSVVDDKAAGATVTSASRVQSAFKLPAQFDSDNNPAHKSVYATEKSRLNYQSARPEHLAMTVRPSGATGLVMRVRIYDASTEDVVLDRRVAQPTTVAVDLPRAADWVIELSPVSASEMPQAGEAKYTVEFAPGAGAPSTRPSRALQH